MVMLDAPAALYLTNVSTQTRHAYRSLSSLCFLLGQYTDSNEPVKDVTFPRI